MVFARRWQRRRLPGRREDRGRGPSHDGNPAAREGTLDGPPVHSGRTLDAAEGTDGCRSTAVTSSSPSCPWVWNRLEGPGGTVCAPRRVLHRDIVKQPRHESPSFLTPA